MTDPALLLRYIRHLHLAGRDRGGDGFPPRCAECGRPHPCETYRATCGDPGWPRPAAEVLAELEQAGCCD